MLLYCANVHVHASVALYINLMCKYKYMLYNHAEEFSLIAEAASRDLVPAVSMHHPATEMGRSHPHGRDSNRLSPYSSHTSSRTPSPRLLGGLGSDVVLNSKEGKCNTDALYGSETSRSLSVPTSLEHHYFSQMKYSRNLHSDGKSRSPTFLTSSYPPASVMKKNSDLLTALEKGLQSSQGHSDKSSATLGLHSKSDNGCKYSTTPVANGPVDGSRTGSVYKRKSPVGTAVNSVPHNFFDPALPIAKRLTESVQKLVKPLLTTESSSLPHSHRKSPINTSKLAAASSPPRLSKGNGSKSPISESLLEKRHLNFSDSVMLGHNSVGNDSVRSLNSASDRLSSHGIERSVFSSFSNSTELPLLHLDSPQGLDFGISSTLTNHTNEDGNISERKSPSELRTNFLGSLLKQTGVARESDEKILKADNTSKSQDLKDGSPNTGSQDNTSDSITNNQLKLEKSPSEDAKMGSCTSVKNVQQVAPLKIKLTDKKILDPEKCNFTSDVKSLEVKTDFEKMMQCVSCKKLQCECSEKGNSAKYKFTKHNDLKSPPLKSPSSSGEISQKAKKMDLEDSKVEVTVVTKPKPLSEQKTDKSEPTVPPLILRVRRKSISESQESDESQSKMTLRTNRGSSKTENSESSTSQHNLRQQKSVRGQTNVEPAVNKGEKLAEKVEEVSKMTEEESSKRSLRKRKNPTSEAEPEVKKTNTDMDETPRQTRSSDVKDAILDSGVKSLRSVDAKENNITAAGVKSDSNKSGEKPAQLEILENDLAKSGLRNREKAKPIVSDDKVTGKNVNNREVKEFKRTKSVEEEDRGKRQPSRRNKVVAVPQTDKSQKTPSPQLNEKPVVNGK